jgi:cation diffusion facilitator CzcD-associated flavoprotein CzcO
MSTTATTATTPIRPTEGTHHRVGIVGTGFAGVGMAVALRKAGMEDFVVFERAGDVGGTWRDNTYPGCQCDVPSALYSFSFAPNPEWTHTYPLQPELGAYVRNTAERHGVLGHVRFHTPMQDARWDDDSQRWEIETPSGVETVDVLIMASGPLSEPKLPDVPGLERFRGTTFHSAAWNHDHDLSGERVAVIGTGASAIQFVPHIQPQAGQVTVFQRTPPWVVPHPGRKILRWERRLYRLLPVLQKLKRYNAYWIREAIVSGFTKNRRVMKGVERLGRSHLKRQVADPELRAKLTPTYAAGCKRLLLSNDWYPALSQPNVSVVTAGISEVREHSVVASDGTEHEVDTIVFGTGFHVTDNPIMGRVHGRDGRSLADVWEESGMRAYKGTTVAGFPNLFFLAGANTGIGHTSLVVMIEAQVRYVLDALRWMDANDQAIVEVSGTALETYNENVQARMAPSVWNVGGCASWYQDAHGNNPTLWPDYTWKFCLATRQFDADRYVIQARVAQPQAEGQPAAA